MFRFMFVCSVCNKFTNMLLQHQAHQLVHCPFQAKYSADTFAKIGLLKELLCTWIQDKSHYIYFSFSWKVFSSNFRAWFELKGRAKRSIRNAILATLTQVGTLRQVTFQITHVFKRMAFRKRWRASRFACAQLHGGSWQHSVLRTHATCAYALLLTFRFLITGTGASTFSFPRQQCTWTSRAKELGGSP